MRIRDIVHCSGRRLRVVLDRGDEAMMIQLSDPSCAGDPVMLDPYGTELLAGFLLSARLSGGQLAEEWSGGLLGCRFRLTREHVELSQDNRLLLVPSSMWDRLYAELMLAVAHARHHLPSGHLHGQLGRVPGLGLLH
jgi:hypothetical protein